MTINNLPAYAADYRFIVVRKVRGELWFYGAFNDYDRAVRAACECGGTIV